MLNWFINMETIKMIQNNEEEYKAWDQITDKLYDEGRFEELIEKYEDSYDKFPDHEYEMYTDVLFLHRQLNNNEKCLDHLEKCIDKGFFYGLEWKTWNSLKNGSRWNKIVETNENNRASQPPSKMEYKVYTPEGYDKNKKYPLFFLLHGNTQTMELFKGQWKPDFLLKKNYIVTYIQSSYWFTKTGFGWTVDCARDRKEIADCYSSVIRDYNINVDNVILGGFSGGAMASINVMMNNLFPIKGVMALCPMKQLTVPMKI